MDEPLVFDEPVVTGPLRIEFYGDPVLAARYQFNARRLLGGMRIANGINDRVAAGEPPGFYKQTVTAPDGVVIEAYSNNGSDLVRIFTPDVLPTAPVVPPPPEQEEPRQISVPEVEFPETPEPEPVPEIEVPEVELPPEPEPVPEIEVPEIEVPEIEEPDTYEFSQEVSEPEIAPVPEEVPVDTRGRRRYTETSFVLDGEDRSGVRYFDNDQGNNTGRPARQENITVVSNNSGFDDRASLSKDLFLVRSNPAYSNITYTSDVILMYTLDGFIQPVSVWAIYADVTFPAEPPIPGYIPFTIINSIGGNSFTIEFRNVSGYTTVQQIDLGTLEVTGEKTFPPPPPGGVVESSAEAFYDPMKSFLYINDIEGFRAPVEAVDYAPDDVYLITPPPPPNLVSPVIDFYPPNALIESSGYNAITESSYWQQQENGTLLELDIADPSIVRVWAFDTSDKILGIAHDRATDCIVGVCKRGEFDLGFFVIDPEDNGLLIRSQDIDITVADFPQYDPSREFNPRGSIKAGEGYLVLAFAIPQGEGGYNGGGCKKIAVVAYAKPDSITTKYELIEEQYLNGALLSQVRSESDVEVPDFGINKF